MGDALACCHDLVREPRPLGPDDDRRRRAAPQRLAGAGDQRDALAGQLVDRAHARQGHREDRSHRRAHGLGPVGIGGVGSDGHAVRAEGQRAAQDRPHVARVVDAPQRHAQRAGRALGPPLLVDGERAGPRAQRAHLGQRLGLDVLTGHVALERRPPGRVGGGEQVLALGDEATAVVPAKQPADLLELGVVVGGDHRCGHKKGAFAEAPGRFGFVGLAGYAADASRAASAKRRKVSASRTAMSARTLRSSSIPASLSPCMKVP